MHSGWWRVWQALTKVPKAKNKQVVIVGANSRSPIILNILCVQVSTTGTAGGLRSPKKGISTSPP